MSDLSSHVCVFLPCLSASVQWVVQWVGTILLWYNSRVCHVSLNATRRNIDAWLGD